MLFGCIIMASGACLVFPVNIGAGPWDAFGITVSSLLHMKLGYLQIILNVLCILGQKVLEGRDFKKIQYGQLLFAVFQGMVVNFFLYTVYKDLYIGQYFLRVLALTGGYFIGALGITVIMECNLVRNPLEGFCYVLGERLGKEMGLIRMGVDMFCVAFTLIVSLLAETHLYLREGTIIGMLALGPFLIFWKRRIGAFVNTVCEKGIIIKKEKS